MFALTSLPRASGPGARREATESTAPAERASAAGQSRFGSSRPSRGRLPAPRTRLTSARRGGPEPVHADGWRCRGSRAEAGRSGGRAAEGDGIHGRGALRGRVPRSVVDVRRGEPRAPPGAASAFDVGNAGVPSRGARRCSRNCATADSFEQQPHRQMLRPKAMLSECCG
jgi:hypothetical protein